MRRTLLTLFTILTFWQAYGQTDKHGNPVFNSVSTSERSLDGLTLISNYYTLKNNIENRNSSVYISSSPQLADIETAALKLPSDFFILTKSGKMVAMVLLHNEPKREFMTMIMSSNKQATDSCTLKGDITENRAQELIKEGYDPSASIDNGYLTFNNNRYQIIPNKDIEEAVLALIKKEKLDKKKPSETVMLSKQELKKYVLAESRAGGKLDYFTEIKGKENNGVQVKQGVFTTYMGIALYKWGRACFDIGVNTVEDAYEIFAENKQRELNQREREYIKMGFNKELEK